MNGTNNGSVKTKKLGLWTLVAIATGNVIGAGVITTTGLAIGATGQSVWIAYAVAVVMGFLWILPGVLFSSIAKFKGGAYTIVTALIGEKAGGIYALWWLPMFLMGGLMANATGLYVHSILPAVPALAAGVVIYHILHCEHVWHKHNGKSAKPALSFPDIQFDRVWGYRPWAAAA